MTLSDSAGAKIGGSVTAWYSCDTASLYVLQLLPYYRAWRSLYSPRRENQTHKLAVKSHDFSM